MKTSEFMDKQIMELSRSQSYNFLDLANPHDREEEEDDDENYGALPSFILGAPMDPIDFAEARGDAGMVVAIERTIKEHCENLLHAVEGISARLSQLESRTRQLENSVLDLKESVEFNHGRTYGKLGDLENIMKEVQGGIQDIRDKQEIAEAQRELAQLHLSKSALKFGNPNSTGQTNLSQKPLSSVPQQPSPVQQQFCQPLSIPVTCPQLPAFPSNVHPNLPHQNPPPTATATAPQLPIQLHQNIIPSIPQPDIYFSPPVSIPETTHQRYHSLPIQQSQPPTPEQQPYPPEPQLPLVSQLPQLPRLHPVSLQYQPAPQLPLISQLPQLPQQNPPVSTVNPQDHRPLNRQPEEVPYMPSQSYSLGIHQSSQPPSQAPPPQQFYAGSAPQTYDEPSSWPHSEFSSGHLQPPEHSSFNDLHGYSNYSHYSSSKMKPSQFSLPPSVQRGGSSYSQLPTAQILPHALPTASSVDTGSDSGGTNSRVIDDVVDKVVSMGFRRDLVSATVKKLTENGQSVDLNAVLDKLMNDGDVHTFGR